MPDPAPHLTPATPDELAATYLRARDVPCPGCGYNRRDGVRADCPECGEALLVRNGSPLERPVHVSALRRIANIIVLMVALLIAGRVYSIVQFFVMTSGGPRPPGLTLSIVVMRGTDLLIAAIAIILARRATRALRPMSRDVGRALRLLAWSIFVGLASGVLRLPLAFLAYILF